MCLSANLPFSGEQIRMAACNAGDAFQLWNFDRTTGQIRLYANWGDEQCIDPRGPSLNPGTVLQTWSCGGGIVDQHKFLVNLDWQFQSNWPGFSWMNACFDLLEPSGYPQLQTCNAGDGAQQMAIGQFYC